MKLAARLDDCFAAVVVGRDPAAAAALALGIAQSQSAKRRVAICDLVGDVPPLQRLVKSDDPHGIVDSFQYGVSLNKIAYQVGPNENLFIMPSGTEPVVDESIIRSDRWRRLSGGFREVGALLLLVANADAAGLDSLLQTTDGLILAGEDAVTGLGPVLATAALPAVAPRRERPSVAGQDERRAAPRATNTTWILPALGVLVVMLAIGGWWTRRQRGAPPPAPAVTAEDPSDSVPGFVFSAPLGDSATASMYGVEIVKLNTESGAILKLNDALGKLPAVTYSPVMLGTESGRWYTVSAGAFRSRSSADSLLASLRERGVLESGDGIVVRLPFALVLEPEVRRDGAAAVVKAYIGRGLPAYALLQEDGTARIYAGAFDTPDDAAILAASVRAAGIEPTVAYRMGRTF